MSALPPSPFLNSAASDAAADTAVAIATSPQFAAAGPIEACSSQRVIDPACDPRPGLSGAPAQESPLVISELSMVTGGPQEAPAATPTVTVAAGAAGATDCIGEIFRGAARLDDHRFVLDEHAFLDAIEEPPLFLRDYAWRRRMRA